MHNRIRGICLTAGLLTAFAEAPALSSTITIDGDMPDFEARCVNEDGKLIGFALTGEATNKRRDYIKEAPPLME